MNTTVRLLRLGVAGLAVALTAAACQSASPTPVPSAAGPSSASEAEFLPQGEIAVGRHSMVREGVHLSIRVSSERWQSNGSFRIAEPRHGERSPAFIFWSVTPDGVYADPCAQTKGPVIGADLAVLAAGVAGVPGTDVIVAPTEVSIGGRPAQHVALSIRDDVECGAGVGGMRLWYDEEIGGRYPDHLGDEMRVWIIDAGDALVWIDAETPPGATEYVEEMQEIVDSIQFE